MRGAWGEVQLRRVLEASGMLPRCDFDEQVTAVSAHGRGVRPDVVVRLPGGKVLVVDAKAPMIAFLDAQAEDLPDDERAALLAEHAAGLGRHVSALAAKEYWSAFREGPEMVVCFVPSDAMLGAALAAQPALHERALAQRVVLVGPGSLMALLRTVAFTWQQDALSANARELLDLGRDLHRRLGTLGAHTAKVGRSLQSSVEAYNAMVGALESRVMVTARRMHDLDLVGDELPRAHAGRDRAPAADLAGAHRRRDGGRLAPRPPARPRPACTGSWPRHPRRRLTGGPGREPGAHAVVRREAWDDWPASRASTRAVLRQRDRRRPGCRGAVRRVRGRAARRAGAVPLKGIRRLRPRRKQGTVSGFTLVDVGGNWLRFYRPGGRGRTTRDRSVCGRCRTAGRRAR